MKRRVILLLATIAVALLMASGVTLAQSQDRGENNPPGLPTASETARGAPPEEAQLLRQLGQAVVSRHTQTGELDVLAAPSGDTISRPSGVAANASAESAARGYMVKYGPLFGIQDLKSELHTEWTQSASEGKDRSVVRFRQLYKGVPVLAGELNVEVDGTNNLLVASGEALPDISLDVEPTVSIKEAQQTALQKVAKDNNLTTTSLRASKPKLWIYDSRLLGGPGLDVPQLVWRMDVSAASQPAGPNELVLVDAHSGYVALNSDQTETALNRKTYTMNHSGDESARPGQLLCTEQVSFQCLYGDADAVHAHDYARDTYNFYNNRYGRDSLNGEGMDIISSIHFGQGWANAKWKYNQVFYGDGFAVDDVVGHELTHGVTQYTSGLFYYFQSGAINESLSDTWGEWIDLTNGKGNDSPGVSWLYGEDLPGGAGRSMQNPPAFGDPDRMTSPLYYADPLLKDAGGVHENSGVGNKAAFLITHGGSFNGFSVKGLGIDKAAQIYYKVQTELLTSGSDYNDLGNYLKVACDGLKGTAGITSDDCVQVGNAVAATEMNEQPPVTQAPDAPVCKSGWHKDKILLSDDMETKNFVGWKVSQDTWVYDSYYATSGKTSLHTEDPATKADFSLERDAAVTVPTKGKTYLRFNHAYQFDNPSGASWDGGVVEYHTSNNPSWTDAGSLFTNNSGYTGQLQTGTGNVLGGRKAFVGRSNGYRSSRVNLTSLAGQQVWFRFRLGTDNTVGDPLGWFIDDVQVYRCTS